MSTFPWNIVAFFLYNSDAIPFSFSYRIHHGCIIKVYHTFNPKYTWTAVTGQVSPCIRIILFQTLGQEF